MKKYSNEAIKKEADNYASCWKFEKLAPEVDTSGISHDFQAGARWFRKECHIEELVEVLKKFINWTEPVMTGLEVKLVKEGKDVLSKIENDERN